MVYYQKTSSLQQQIVNLIHKHGAIPLDLYMSLALADPEYGYYNKKNPFGQNGDFITAPEISQMFGELLAVWILKAWQKMGKPAPFVFCEIGPGRGTLMNDIARTLIKLAPECFESSIPFLVEKSSRLASLQKENLSSHGERFQWVDAFSKIPSLPIILVANELFDALPIRQFLFKNGVFYEKMICINENGELCFIFLKNYNFSVFHFSNFNLPNDNTILEISHARYILASEISQKILKNRGTALIIDYGILDTKKGEISVGDTLQAISKHKFCHPLEHPGECDLTSHVNFSVIAKKARKDGCHTAGLTQAEFLLKLGLLERARKLGTRADTVLQKRLQLEVERLISPNQMGELFKFFCITDPQTTPLFPFSMGY